MSDTYASSYFKNNFKSYLGSIKSILSYSLLIKSKINYYLEEIKQIEENIELNTQFETIKILCSFFEYLINHSITANLITPTKIDLGFSFSKMAIEKINDLEKVFKNLFEYVFLVRYKYNRRRKNGKF